MYLTVLNLVFHPGMNLCSAWEFPGSSRTDTDSQDKSGRGRAAGGFAGPAPSVGTALERYRPGNQGLGVLAVVTLEQKCRPPLACRHGPGRGVGRHIGGQHCSLRGRSLTHTCANVSYDQCRLGLRLGEGARCWLIFWSARGPGSDYPPRYGENRSGCRHCLHRRFGDGDRTCGQANE